MLRRWSVGAGAVCAVDGHWDCKHGIGALLQLLHVCRLHSYPWRMQYLQHVHDAVMGQGLQVDAQQKAVIQRRQVVTFWHGVAGTHLQHM